MLIKLRYLFYLALHFRVLCLQTDLDQLVIAHGICQVHEVAHEEDDLLVPDSWAPFHLEVVMKESELRQVYQQKTSTFKQSIYFLWSQ